MGAHRTTIKANINNEPIFRSPVFSIPTHTRPETGPHLLGDLNGGRCAEILAVIFDVDGRTRKGKSTLNRCVKIQI